MAANIYSSRTAPYASAQKAMDLIHKESSLTLTYRNPAILVDGVTPEEKGYAKVGETRRCTGIHGGSFGLMNEGNGVVSCIEWPASEADMVWTGERDFEIREDGKLKFSYHIN